MGTRTLAMMFMLGVSPVSANALEPIYSEVADYVGVPAPILYAMSQAESGLLHDGQFVPWPWTLNVAGTAQRFEDRQAMFTGLMDALQSGVMMVDVGPMQLNWYWQYNTLGSPWRITDPAVNIKLAAHILKTHHERTGDWWEAVGRYHRPADGPKNRMIADRYRQRVRRFYNNAQRTQGSPDAAQADTLIRAQQPTVVYDGGGTLSAQPYYQRFKRDDPVNADSIEAPSGVGVTPLEDRLPLSPKLLSVGPPGMKAVPGLVTPVFVMGMDEASLLWFREAAPGLSALGARGLVVQASDREAWLTLREQAQQAGLDLMLMAGDALARSYVMRTYPMVLISPEQARQIEGE